MREKKGEGELTTEARRHGAEEGREGEKNGNGNGYGNGYGGTAAR